MGRILENSKFVAGFLKETLESFNAGDLAASSQRRHPEFKLVEYIRDRLSQNPRIGKVLKHFKNVHESLLGITFLYQPELDLVFQYEGFLHGVEFKLLGNTSRFYHGIEEALAYSTYGIDFSWIVHFYRMDYKDSSDYMRWMKYSIEQSRCPSLGYITSTTKSSNILICPARPFSKSL